MAAMKALIKKRELYEKPRADAPPPWWIRALLIFTCTGPSFAHGSNGGQKGMGRIMLILVGTVPLGYALSHAVPDSHTPQFTPMAQVAEMQLRGSLYWLLS